MEKPLELMIKKMISFYPSDWAEFYSNNAQVRKLKEEMDQICHHLFQNFENTDLMSIEEQNQLLKKVEDKGKLLSEIIQLSKNNKSA